MAGSGAGRVGSSGRKGRLQWEVLVAPSIPVRTEDFAPGEHERPWPPTPSTLVFGSRDAVVIDSPITQRQAEAQAAWISSTGKNLTTIYATHGHGDHFLGAGVLRERFPDAGFVAHRDAVRVMRQQLAPEFFEKFWESRFPGQLPARRIVAEELGSNDLELEGERLAVVPLGFTDTEGTTALHVPSLGLVAAGDAVYQGVHPRLVEGIQRGKLGEWIAALDTLSALAPTTVVAGHKDPTRDDSPRSIDGTRQYLLDFQARARTASTARELYDTMLARYPDWLNRGALWSSAGSAFP